MPVVEWSHEQELYDYLVGTSFGQQESIFTQNSSAAAVGHLIDVLSNQVSRINVNCQCQRGPDSFPFTGRKDSAYGTLSVFDALRVFSLRSLVAAKDGADAQLVAGEILQICYGVLGFILPNFASDIAAAGTSHVLRADKLLPG